MQNPENPEINEIPEINKEFANLLTCNPKSKKISDKAMCLKHHLLMNNEIDANSYIKNFSYVNEFYIENKQEILKILGGEHSVPVIVSKIETLNNLKNNNPKSLEGLGFTYTNKNPKELKLTFVFTEKEKNMVKNYFEKERSSLEEKIKNTNEYENKRSKFNKNILYEPSKEKILFNKILSLLNIQLKDDLSENAKKIKKNIEQKNNIDDLINKIENPQEEKKETPNPTQGGRRTRKRKGRKGRKSKKQRKGRKGRKKARKTKRKNGRKTKRKHSRKIKRKHSHKTKRKHSHKSKKNRTRKFKKYHHKGGVGSLWEEDKNWQPKRLSEENLPQKKATIHTKSRQNVATERVPNEAPLNARRKSTLHLHRTIAPKTRKPKTRKPKTREQSYEARYELRV